MRMHRHSQQRKKKTGDLTVREAKSKYVLGEVILQNREFPVPRSTSEEGCCLVAKPCLILCNPMDCSLPDLFVHGIWVALSFSNGFS